MKIHGIHVFFDHAGTRFQAILCDARIGGVIENPGMGETMILINANSDETLEFLKEKGIPLNEFPELKSKVVPVESMMTMREAITKVLLAAENTLPRTSLGQSIYDLVPLMDAETRDLYKACCAVSQMLQHTKLPDERNQNETV